MTFKSKYGAIALNEIKTQWKIFIVFFLIMQLLLTALISINNVAMKLPDSIWGYIKDYGINFIYTDFMNTEKKDIVCGLGEDIDYVSIYVSADIIGLDEEKEYIKGDESFYASGTVEQYVKGSSNSVLTYLNDNMIEGDKFCDLDNDEYKIWIADYFMDELKLNCGDEIAVTCSDGAKINCKIAGVFNYDNVGEAFITTIKVLEKVQKEEVELFTSLIMVDNFTDYFKVINVLEENFITYSAEKDEMKSLIMIIYVLIAVDIMVLLISVSFMGTILKIYHMYRREFYVILRTQGLANRDVLGVIVIIMEIIYLCSFLAAECFSPLLNGYLTTSIREIFEQIAIEIDNFSVYDVRIFFAGMIIVFVACVFNQKIFTKDSIKEIFNKGYE